jgi:hypothetical protein
MQPEGKMRNRLQYGRALVNSGLSGLRNGRVAHLQRQPLYGVLNESARGALGLAAIGTCAALLGSCVAARRSRSAKAVGYGVAGSIIGLAVGLAWKTRELTASMGRSALKEMSNVRAQSGTNTGCRTTPSTTLRPKAIG